MLHVVSVASAGPPPRYDPTPGRLGGETTVRWLAPYVQFLSLRIQGEAGNSVRWFNESGEIVREMKDVHVGVPGYVSQGSTYYAVNGDWSVSIPEDLASETGSVKWTPDSRVFIHHHGQRNGPVQIDYYVKGELVNTIGPVILAWRHVRLENDGSLAFVALDESEGRTKLLVVGPGGHEQFKVPCEAQVNIVACDRTRVLVADANDRTRLTLYDREGQTSAFVLRYNPNFLTWWPNTSRALFTIVEDRANVLAMVDCLTGEVIWKSQLPNAMLTYGPQAVFLDSMLLVRGLEIHEARFEVKNPTHPNRFLLAIESATGRTVARWRSPTHLASPAYMADLLHLGDRVYYVSTRDFSEITAEEIKSNRNGWK